MTIVETISQAKLAFRRQFGLEPAYGAAAPGRVNLIGGHVDYHNGLVLPLAINRYSIVLGARTNTRQGRFYSTHCNELIEVDLVNPIPAESPTWANYVSGVVAGLLHRGLELPGFDAVLHSEVPVGGGLSSSAALEVSVATFLESISDTKLDKVDKARLCQQAENEFVGVPCGIMDQFASVFGEKDRLIKLDCRSQEVDLIAWPGDKVSVLIVDSNSPHQLVDGAYAERKKQSSEALRKLGFDCYRDLTLDILIENRDCLNSVEYLRARHVVTEIARANSCVHAIQVGDWESAGRLLAESHESLRDDYEVSCLQLDQLVEISRDIGIEGGVYGARMTGGGFGGCVILLVRAEQAQPVSEMILARYLSRSGIQASAFVTVPSRGAFAFTPQEYLP